MTMTTAPPASRDRTPMAASDPSGHATLDHLGASGLSVRCRWQQPQPDEPHFEGCAVTVGASTQGSAQHFFSASEALGTAVRAAVAHLVWREAPRLPERMCVGAAGSLRGRAVLLDAIAGYSQALRARQASALGFSRTTEFVWLQAVSLTEGSARWLPAQLVSALDAGRWKQALGREPELRPCVPTGVAAGIDRTSAILDGLLDVIARDAFMLTWLCRLPPEVLDLDHAEDEELAEVVTRLQNARLEPYAVRLQTDVPVPVVLGMVRDTTRAGPALGVAVVARPCLVPAVTDALTQAFTSWRAARRLRGEGRAAPAESSRLDREGRLLWWADERRWPGLGWLLAGPRRPLPPEDASTAGVGDHLACLLSWFREAGEEVLAIDLTDDALCRRLGHHVVGVVVPGFHPLHLVEARPARWSRRLHTVPATLGLPTPAMLNCLPHPLAPDVLA